MHVSSCLVWLLIYCCIVVLYRPLLKWHCGRTLERLCAVFRWPMVALCLMYSGFWFVLNCNCLVDDGTSDSALHGSGFDLKFDHKLQVQASYM